MARSRRITLGVAVLALAPWAGAQEPPGHTHPPGTPAHEHPAEPVRMTMDELHQHGGVPPGWHFTMPPGDPKEGRAVFVKLECYSCHAVKGESFPTAAKGAEDVGPELTGMGSHHPAEYLAESLVNPNAVIVTGAGYTGSDGLSRMPDYGDVLTVRQLIDLVAYIKSLTADHGGMPMPAGTMPMPSGAMPHGHGAPSPPKTTP